MEEDMRDELVRYFERDIGRPPAGARERVLAGLRGAAPRVQSRPLQWLAGSAAAVLMLFVVGTLLLSRAGGPHPQPAGPPDVPGPRSGAAVGYDPERGALVVFGGTGANGAALGDTWTWDGRRWTREHPALSPTPSGAVAAAFDDERGTLVLYARSGETWTWNGRSWTRGAVGPATSGPIAMAYDPRTRAVLLYTAQSDGSHGLWSWDGATWSQLHPPALPAVSGAAMAWDGAQVLLVGTPFGPVGGQFVTETWGWDGRTWSQLAPAVRLPIGTYSATAEGRGGVVVFVVPEDTRSPETWVWDGASWRKEHPAHQPPARPDPALAYDRGANRVVLYDGDLWTWDGTDWALVEEGVK